MTPVDYLILAAAGVIGATFIPWQRLMEYVRPAARDDRMDCLLAILDAVDVCDEHGHSELADELETLLPEAAKCLRRSE